MRENNVYAKQDCNVNGDENPGEPSHNTADSGRALKRRRLHSQTRIVGLVPFWIAVDSWLGGLTEKWGQSTNHPEWRRYFLLHIKFLSDAVEQVLRGNSSSRGCNGVYCL